MLDIKLVIQYPGFSLNAEFTTASKGVTALFGHSGCGKTSILRAIAGLDKHANSHITFNAQTWQSSSTFVASHQRRIAYVFQDSLLFPHLDVMENIRFGETKADKSLALEEILDLLQIGPLLKKPINSLSGGEKQRVAIARALNASPQLLLMDEPLAALDGKAKLRLLSILQSLQQRLDIPMLYVSHSVPEVARLADHLVYLNEGSVIASGNTAELLTDLKLPLAHATEAGAMLNAAVVDQKRDLLVVDTAVGQLLLPAHDGPVPKELRLHIAARDVSIALSKPQDSSILNILPATITDITPESNGQALLQLQAETGRFLAKISQTSLQRLSLNKGAHVYAQIKGIALFL
ncbi:MAG: molybdenum ABC transporter ATP-binding protein [Gammaproteobacteria bacterium]|nr:molybdenum ABC transporter ATP-binding protein [Gammaproteobacteria bacterium]